MSGECGIKLNATSSPEQIPFMSEWKAVSQLGDEEIALAGENSHAMYYKIGKKVTVTWMPGYKLFLCLTCNLNECAHTKRLERWMEEQSESTTRSAA